MAEIRQKLSDTVKQLLTKNFPCFEPNGSINFIEILK